MKRLLDMIAGRSVHNEIRDRPQFLFWGSMRESIHMNSSLNLTGTDHDVIYQQFGVILLGISILPNNPPRHAKANKGNTREKFKFPKIYCWIGWRGPQNFTR